MESLIAHVKALPTEEKLAIGQWLAGALPTKSTQESAAAAAPAPAPEKPLIPARHKMELAPPAGNRGVPTADDYRLPVFLIDDTICMGRRITYEDARWAPHVLGEGQCENKPADGDDLCPTCRRRLEKYAANPKPGAWTGRISEEPEGWLHMLGTAWAEHKQPKWVGGK